jgi:hypothetical protein
MGVVQDTFKARTKPSPREAPTGNNPRVSVKRPEDPVASADNKAKKKEGNRKTGSK